jgi:hypothetical protein
MWTADFGMSLTRMCVFVASELFENNQSREIIVLEKRTSLLPRSRQEALEDAIYQDCTHALFVDSDQSFPMDTLHRLMAWKKPVVACNIAVKTNPSFPTARARGATSFGVPVTSDLGKNGLEKVWRIGCGVMLIDLSIVKPLPKPWFEVRYSAVEAQFIGEDWDFVDKVQNAGHDVYVDHGLSREIGHVGQFNFTHINIPEVPADLAA